MSENESNTQPDDVVEPDPIDAVKDAVAEATEEPTWVEFNEVSYEIDEDATSDVEVVENLYLYWKKHDGTVLPAIVEAFVGPAQYRAFKKAHADEVTGRVEMTTLAEFWRKINAALGE